jgi:hypothetical protein
MGKDDEELIVQFSLASKDHLIFPTQHHIANTITASVAIAVQRGKALVVSRGKQLSGHMRGTAHAAA